MSESKHTPGPWFARKTFSGSSEIAAENGDGATIARTREDADASLIAAAPDLLEALRGVLQQFAKRLRVDSVERARAAIAKAEGGQV